MKKILLSFIFSLIFGNVFAQNIDKINLIFDKIANAKSDTAKIVLNDTIKEILSDFLNDEKSFDADFKQVKYIGKVSSKDDLLNIYTWNIPLDTSMIFNCFIQQKSGKIYFLSQKNSYKPTENQTIYADKWYGALYYQVVPFKRDENTYYLLAGLGQYKTDSKIKVLDVLEFQLDKPTFGHPVFLNESKIPLLRIVFEYDASTAMYLEYNEKKKRFEFDHLSPARIENDEAVSFGADMSIDGYKQSGDYWRFVNDLDVKNRKIKK